MPISQNILFQCKNCGYKEFRKIGDVFPSPNALKPCPKCGGSMQKMDEKEKNLIDKITEIITKL